MLVLLLALLQVLPMLFACTPIDAPEKSESDTTDAITTDAVPEPGVANLMKDGKLLYTTIKYATAGDLVFAAMEKLQNKIKDVTGEKPKIVEDTSSDMFPPDSSTYEILVGMTNYPESKQVHETVIYGDYKIAIVGNKIVVAAHTDKEISRAITYICTTMLKKKGEDGKLLLDITNYEYVSNKKYLEISINGTPIKDFTIVYGSAYGSDSYSKASAEQLKNTLSERAGLAVDVIRDIDVSKCTTPHKIYIGTDFRQVTVPTEIGTQEKMSYTAKTVNGDFYIVAGGYLSGFLAVTKVINENLSGSIPENKVDIKDSEGTFLDVIEQPKTEGTEFRVMTYNVMAQWSGWGGDYMPVPQRYEAFKAIIDGYSPDVVGLQEVSSQWSEKILNEMKDTYTFVNRKTPDGKFVNLSTIIYKHDKFDLIDSGLQYFSYNGPNQIRLVNWAIFKDKETGKQFAFFNTHWMFYSIDNNDGQRKSHSEEHAVIINKVMANHPDVKYAFSTGDYNTELDHEYCKNFLKNANLINSLDIAKAAGTLKNNVGGSGSLGVPRKDMTGGGQIDNIFVTNNMKVLRHETILWNCVEHVSDHSPKYADIVLGD